MTEPVLLTDEVRAWIGRETSYEAPEPIGRAAIRYFAMAVGDLQPCYLDDDDARLAGFDGIVAPPTLLCESNQFVGIQAADDSGYIGHLWPLPVTGCRTLRGGNRYRFDRPARPDDVITSTWRLDSIEEKRSSSGTAMLVVRSTCTYTDAEGAVVATNQETVIHQELPR